MPAPKAGSSAGASRTLVSTAVVSRVEACDSDFARRPRVPFVARFDSDLVSAITLLLATPTCATIQMNGLDDIEESSAAPGGPNRPPR